MITVNIALQISKISLKELVSNIDGSNQWY